MLDLLRRHSQSWLIKVIFGAIILVFIFFGVYTYRGAQPSGSGVLAYVGDKPILMRDFVREYDGKLRQIQQQDSSMTREEADRQGFRRMVFDNMVSRELISQQAEKLGVGISETELRAEIGRLPFFQNEKGQFDSNLYTRKLGALNTNVEAFERDQKNAMLQEKMLDYATLPAYLSMASIRSTFDFVQEKAVVDYIPFMAADFVSQVSVAPEEIQKMYDAQKTAYKLPTMIKIEYLAVTPGALSDPKSVTDADAKAYYDANLDKFKHDAMIQANHLLVPLPENATDDQVKAAEKRLNDLAAHLRKGEPMAKVLAIPGAPAVQGDDLGWIGKEGTKPEFESAFALKKGEISAPIRTKFGLHLIQVTDKKAEGVTSLDEAKADIKKEIAANKVSETLGKVADQMLEELIGGAKLEKLAKDKGLTVSTTDYFSIRDIPKELEFTKESANLLFSLPAGKALPQVVAAGNGLTVDGMALVRVLDVRPEHVPALEEISDTIKKDILVRKSAQIAEAKAKETVGLLATPEGQAKVEAQYKTQFKTSEPFNRFGPIPDFGPVPQLSSAAFAAKAPGWLGAFAVPGGVVLAKLEKRAAPEESEWQARKDQFARGAQNAQEEQIYRSYLGALREKTPVRIVNQQILAVPAASGEKGGE